MQSENGLWRWVFQHAFFNQQTGAPGIFFFPGLKNQFIVPSHSSFNSSKFLLRQVRQVVCTSCPHACMTCVYGFISNIIFFCIGSASISARKAMILLSGFFPFINPITPVVAFTSKGIPDSCKFFLNKF